MTKLINKPAFQYAYITLIVLAQLVVLFTVKTPIVQWVSGLAGALYVSTLTFSKKYTFLVALVFNTTMLFIGIQHGILSEIIQQPLFMAMGIIGFVHMNFQGQYKFINNTLERIRNIEVWKILLLSIIVMVVWTFISKGLGSPIWWKDGILGGVAISAQLFSIAGNKYSWFYWMTLDALTTWTWFTLATPNIAMGVLYLIFLANAIFGYIVWNASKKESL